MGEQRGEYTIIVCPIHVTFPGLRGSPCQGPAPGYFGALGAALVTYLTSTLHLQGPSAWEGAALIMASSAKGRKHSPIPKGGPRGGEADGEGDGEAAEDVEGEAAGDREGEAEASMEGDAEGDVAGEGEGDAVTLGKKISMGMAGGDGTGPSSLRTKVQHKGDPSPMVNPRHCPGPATGRRGPISWRNDRRSSQYSVHEEATETGRERANMPILLGRLAQSCGGLWKWRGWRESPQVKHTPAAKWCISGCMSNWMTWLRIAPMAVWGIAQKEMGYRVSERKK